jgi:hypothetical protein
MRSVPRFAAQTGGLIVVTMLLFVAGYGASMR